MLTGVQKKFSSLAAFRGLASDHGADHQLDTIQREAGRLFQMGEDIRSGAISPDVKSEMLNLFNQASSNLLQRLGVCCRLLRRSGTPVA